ncbi:MAG: hypothetical protein BM556_18080 [Bacteriovorax sp. MedPE-SWde]|nr:MAG: hypothetical protein BM556_18080 [Bacteriovorax sp. MedPE-SWde]
MQILKLLIFVFSFSCFAEGPVHVKHDILDSQEIVTESNGKGVEKQLLKVDLSQFISFESGPITIFLDLPTSVTTEFYLVDRKHKVVKKEIYKERKRKVRSQGSGFVPSIEILQRHIVSHELYILVEKPIFLEISFSVLDSKEFRRFEGMKISTTLLFLGGATAVGLFILCFSLILRDLSFLYYFLFLLFVTPSSADVRGVIQFLSNGYMDYGSTFRLISSNLSFAFCLLFTSEYFKVKKYSKTLWRVSSCITMLFFLNVISIGVLSIFDVNILAIVQKSFLIYFSLFIGISLFIPSYFFKISKRESLVYFFTWGGFFCFVTIWVLALIGVLEFHHWMNGILYLGFIFQSLILMFGVWNLNEKELVSSLKAKESLKLKNLLRVVCHDSINLLNVALAQSDNMIEDNQQDPNVNLKAWKKVNDATKDQIELLNHVRKVDAIESGKIKLELSPTNINTLILRAPEIFESNLKNKNIHIELDLSDGLPLVDVEPVSMLNNVINNLVSNAIKFSYKDGVIHISSKVEGDYVIVSIRDNGMGMPEELLGKLFSSTEKTSRKGTNDEEGTGFGMPLVKTTLEAFGADISVTSTEGSGSEFVLRLNYSSEIAEKNTQTEFLKTSFPNLKLIVLDDDVNIRDLLRLWLNKLKVQFKLCSQYSHLIEELKKNHYDVLFLDQNLDGELGTNLMTEIYNISKNKNIMIFIMSADNASVKELSLEKGPDGFIDKPITKKKLVHYLSKVH